MDERPVRVGCCANTNIKGTSERLKPPGRLRRWYAGHMKKLIPTAEKAARSIILAASAPHVTGGDDYGPGGLFELGGEPRPARLNPLARDAQLSELLWHKSESMTGARYLSGL